MIATKRIPALSVFCVIGAALALTGCWKDIISESNDLKFSAAYSVGTKAVYGVDVNGTQQILWQGTDDVRISSDYAVTMLGRRFSDYTVTPQSGESDATHGKISRKATVIGNTEDSGLRWIDNASGSASFWSVYPASAMSDNELQNITFTIPSSTSLQTAVKQPSGNVVKILDPVNGSYPMVACTSGVSANTNLVKLNYYPAFTSFQITLLNDSEGTMTLNYCSLTSSTNDLCGTFTAPIEDLAQASPVTSRISTSSTGQTVSAGLNQPLQSGESVTFSIFCLPTDLTDLTLACNFTDENGTQTKTLALNRSGSAISFDACKQHRINLRFKGGTVDVEMTPVIALIVSSAFGDDYEYKDGEVVDKSTGEKVDLEELQQAILAVHDVTISDDHGIDTVNYVNGMFAFTNLETLTIDGANSIQSVTVEGLPHFKELNIIYADAISSVNVSDCPWTETVNINTRSLHDISLNNLTKLKTLTVDEGGANSNLRTFTLTNCYDLETAHFGEIGALEELDLSGCSKLTDLTIDLAYKLKDVDLTGCSSLKSIYINDAQTLPLLDIDPCTSLESLILVNPQNLLRFTTNSTTLHTLKFIGNNGSQNLVTMSLDTPSLSTIEMTNNQSLANLTLSNLPSAISSLQTIVPAFSQNGSRALRNLSLTNCSGFTSISIDSAQSIAQMNFDSCSALRSVTLYGNSAANVWANPPTTTIVATKRNCPNLSSYTVNNWGTIGTYQFTNP